MSENISNIETNAFEANAKRFAAQFDPNSATYHNGDQRIVPLGGKRVPDDLKAHLENGACEASAPPPLSKETQEKVDRVMSLRKQVGDLKQALSRSSSWMPALGQETHAGHSAALKSAAELKRMVEKVFESLEDEETEAISLVHKCLDAMVADTELSKQQLGQFATDVRFASQALFRIQKKQLEQIKQLKKNDTNINI